MSNDPKQPKKLELTEPAPRKPFDCNKCGKIIMRDKARCLMGGKKGEIPDICYEYGAVCKECFNLAVQNKEVR